MVAGERARRVEHEQRLVHERKKERKQTTQGRDGRTARRHHTGILRRGVWCASRRPPLGVRLFLSHFAVSLRFLPRPSCHLSVVPLSSFSLLSLLPLSRRSPLPRSAPPPPPAVPLFNPREGWKAAKILFPRARPFSPARSWREFSPASSHAVPNVKCLQAAHRSRQPPPER